MSTRYSGLPEASGPQAGVPGGQYPRPHQPAQRVARVGRDAVAFLSFFKCALAAWSELKKAPRAARGQGVNPPTKKEKKTCALTSTFKRRLSTIVIVPGLEEAHA